LNTGIFILKTFNQILPFPVRRKGLGRFLETQEFPKSAFFRRGIYYYWAKGGDPKKGAQTKGRGDYLFLRERSLGVFIFTGNLICLSFQKGVILGAQSFPQGPFKS